MARCEDYPCCGHGPPPHGDGGGCPEVDSHGRERFRCVRCHTLMEPKAPSAICNGCRQRFASMSEEEREWEFERWEREEGYY